MKEPICPLIKAECSGHACTFYTHIVGLNPQTGKEVDQFDCAIKWLPMLLVEVSSKTRQNSASLDKLREEAVGAFRGIGDIMARRLDKLDTVPALSDQSSRPDRNT